MIGKNTIVMNQATLNRAVEHYLNGVVLQDDVIVKNVTSLVTYDNATKTNVPLFHVEIEPSPDALGEDDDAETCEGCNAPAVGHDSDNLPLCQACLDSLIAESKPRPQPTAGEAIG